MHRKLLLASIVCGLISIAVQPLSSAATNLPSLTGSWQFVLTPSTPSTTPPVVPIPGLATFTSNHTVVETDGTEFATVPPPTAAGPIGASPGHGIWQPGNTPTDLYVEFFSLLFNPDGSLYAENVTTMLVTLNAKGNQFQGSYQINQTMGSITRALSSGTVQGRLIPHVPLP